MTSDPNISQVPERSGINNNIKQLSIEQSPTEQTPTKQPPMEQPPKEQPSITIIIQELAILISKASSKIRKP